MIKIIIKKTPEDYDSDDVYFDVDGVRRGYGFVPKNPEKKGKIALTKCPLCGKENYAMSVSSGQCAWCPFNANNLNSHD